MKLGIFDIDFQKDKDLKVGLAMHLQSLLERQKNNVQVTNVYLQEIKRKYLYI
ncbi:MAG: PRD domain-containing protein [Streptococcus sp.]